MTRVSTTAFFTHAWTNWRPDLARLRPASRHGALGRSGRAPGWLRVWWCWVFCAGLIVWAGHAQAADEATQRGTVELQRTSDGLFVSARLPLTLGPAVEDALFKAVPLYFLYQAEVLAPRWYWTDKRIASQTRALRLAFQPLTRRWRLSVSSTAPGASPPAYALHQNFDSLSEAVAAVGRLTRWKVADGQRLEDDVRYLVDFRFRLDLSQLPRPLQIGVANQSDWNFDWQRRLRSTAQPEAVPEPPRIPSHEPAPAEAADHGGDAAAGAVDTPSR